jgi:hypothetical protein
MVGLLGMGFRQANRRIVTVVVPQTGELLMGDWDEGSEWRWHWSPLFGVMYGPVPVAIVAVVCGVAVYFAFFAR